MPTLSRPGYTFLGWKVKLDRDVSALSLPEIDGETTVDVKGGKPFEFTQYGSITFVAQWEENTYTVKFDKNSSSAAGTMADQSFTYDEAAKALRKNAFSRVGYTFNGWNTKKDGSGTAYTDEQTVKNLTTEANGVVTLYAQWNINLYPFVFDSQGGSEVEAQTIPYLGTAIEPADPTRAGYWFNGWYTDKTYRTPYNFATPLTQDTTIYAKWFLIVLPGVTIKKATPKLNTYDHFAYVQGYPDGTVKPAGNITRAELAAMLASFTETTRAANYFDDVSANHWAANAIAICAKLGWITGYPDGSFRPDRNVTRAELMAMINRATGRAPKSADAFLPGMKTWSDNTADKWYYLDVQEATNSHSYAVSPTELWTALTAAPDWSRYE